MTVAIDELLARARLLDDTDTPYDHVRAVRPGAAPAHGRLAATGTGLCAAALPPGSVHAVTTLAGRGRKDGVARAAARDLQSLCEAAVTTAAVTSLRAQPARVITSARCRAAACSDPDVSARFDRNDAIPEHVGRGGALQTLAPKVVAELCDRRASEPLL